MGNLTINGSLFILPKGERKRNAPDISTLLTQNWLPLSLFRNRAMGGQYPGISTSPFDQLKAVLEWA
jgi:hypothetical protein